MVKIKFYSGLNVKRWFLLLVIGGFFLLTAFYFAFAREIAKFTTIFERKLATALNISFANSKYILVGIIFLCGLFLSLIAIFQILNFVYRYADRAFEDAIKEAKLRKGKRICAIGGGTGMYVLLTGLKNYTSNISAIITTMDSGGSSGMLKTDFGILPPGDARNCLIALSTAPEKIAEIMNYRFKKGNIKGHNLGNLMIASLADKYGFERALNIMADLLNTRGKVIPVTVEKVELMAELENNNILKGEANIGRFGKGIKRLFLSGRARATQNALRAIERADLVVLSGGSLFTSILPNLLVSGIKEKLKGRKIVYISNVMTEYPETHGYMMEDHVSEVEKYLGREVNYVIYNIEKPSKEILEKYRKEMKFLVEPKVEHLGKKKFIPAEVLSHSNFARHDPDKLAKEILKLA